MLENTQQSERDRAISTEELFISSDGLLHFPSPNKQATARLVYFPPAGIDASLYESWAALLPKSLELCIIQFPTGEQKASLAIAKLSESLVRASYPNQKLIFLGIYLGAFWAHEVAHHLRNYAWLQIAHLLIADFPPPHLRYSATEFMRTPDFARIMANFFPSDSLTRQSTNSHLQNALHEAELAEQPVSSIEVPLDCPLTAFASAYGQIIDLQSLQTWQQYISGQFHIHMYNEGPFYEQHHRGEFLQTVIESIQHHC